MTPCALPCGQRLYILAIYIFSSGFFLNDLFIYNFFRNCFFRCHFFRYSLLGIGVFLSIKATGNQKDERDKAATCKEGELVSPAYISHIYLLSSPALRGLKKLRADASVLPLTSAVRATQRE